MKEWSDSLSRNSANLESPSRYKGNNLVAHAQKCYEKTGIALLKPGTSLDNENKICIMGFVKMASFFDIYNTRKIPVLQSRDMTDVLGLYPSSNVILIYPIVPYAPACLHGSCYLIFDELKLIYRD